MKKRKKLLNDLVSFHGNIDELEKELLHYPWDIEKPLVKIYSEDLIDVLNRSLNNEFDFKALTKWAGAIECRDDLEYDNEIMPEIVFELATPEINGEITKERLNKIIDKLLNQ